ncbi:MAG TPA: SRPBCC family protein [Gemmatimonadales bacterium]
MNEQTKYTPSDAVHAEVDKSAEVWTLIVRRELPYAPDKVWRALTDPSELREWAPFDADRDMGSVGPVTLTTVGAPSPQVTETRVKVAEANRALEFNWGGGDQDLRWELEPLANGGTRLTLWHHIDKRFIAMGAAGWHVCLDVLDRFLGGEPIGRTAGMETMKLPAWQQLLARYSKEFGVEAPKWAPQKA